MGAAPFHFSVLVLMLTFLLIQLKWTENYGFRADTGPAADKGSSDGLLQNITCSMDIVLSDPRIFAVGVIQSCFESALYIFIFMWTKALDDVRYGLPFDHGMVFAIMMMS